MMFRQCFKERYSALMVDMNGQETKTKYSFIHPKAALDVKFFRFGLLNEEGRRVEEDDAALEESFGGSV